MNALFAGLMLFFLAVSHVHAQTDVYLCVDEHGKKEYKNTGTTKGCKKVELEGINVVPAPASVSSAKKSVTGNVSTPPDFPKVSDYLQRQRDSDRKQILLDELKAEEQKLASLKKEYNGGDPERLGNEKNYAKYLDRTEMLKNDIARTEKNTEALKREVNNLK
jgi:hypothetical protein